MKYLIVPDTQVKPGVQTDQLSWIGEYAADIRPDRIVHLGDHWDCPSLSIYDKRGGKKMEGKRYEADIAAGNDGFARLHKPIARAMRGGKWKPRLDYIPGNHDWGRINRAIEANPVELDGVISTDDCDTQGWTRHDYLKPVWMDGIAVSHYFYHPNTGRPYASAVETRLKQIGHSFIMGHQQSLRVGMREVGGERHRGLIAGSCYLHTEGYRGPQAEDEWRGVLVLHQVAKGDYSLCEVNLAYLCQRYEGVSLRKFTRGRLR